MKRLASVLFIGLLLAAPAVQAASNPFTGPWRATDTFDGSAMAISVSGGKTTTVNFIDHRGGICVNNQAPTAVFEGTLTGSISGDTMTVTWKKAHCGSVFFDVSGWSAGTWTYDSGTGQLFDGSTYWSRP